MVDSELDALLHDPAVERLHRKTLRDMAADPSDPLRQDLARDLLSGAVTLAQAARSGVYGEVFTESAVEVIDWWQGISEFDRDELMASAEQNMRQFLDEEQPHVR